MLMSELDNFTKAYYTGNSMRGMFKHGDILLLSSISFGMLESGDIVAVFDCTPHYVHRIIDKTPDYAVTMGDNNPQPDEMKLTRKSKFMIVDAFIPGESPKVVLQVDGGYYGMRQFYRQQRILRFKKTAGKLFPFFRKLGVLRIPARKETRFRDGTVQWSCCGIPVAASTPDGKTQYLHWSKRLFFRIPAQIPDMESENFEEIKMKEGNEP